MTGTLHLKNKTYYAVLYVKQGKQKQKWINTGYPERGNKKAATAVLNAILEKYADRESFEGIDFSRFKQGQTQEIAPFSQQDASVEIVYAERMPDVAPISVPIVNKPKVLVSDYVLDFLTTKKNERSRPFSPSTWKGYMDIYSRFENTSTVSPAT